MKTISDLFEKKVFDNDTKRAKTLAELSVEYGYSIAHMNRLVREKIELGEVEKVWRSGGSRVIPVYRLKTK